MTDESPFEKLRHYVAIQLGITQAKLSLLPRQ